MASIEAALVALESQEPPNYTATAKLFQVDRSTLSRRHRGVMGTKEEKVNKARLLTTQQEKTLTEYINKPTDRGLPPTPAMVRNFARDIGKVEPAKNWLSRFLKRNRTKLDSGFQPGFDLSRKKADNHHEYKLYFEKVDGPDWQFSYTYMD